MTDSSLYLFYGSESYLIEEAIQKIVAKRIPPEERDMNFSNYDLLTNPLEELMEEAETLPFLADHKIILGKNALLFTGQKIKLDHDIKKLERWIENPPSYSTIIFWVPYEKLDERKKIVKLIKKHGVVKNFNALKGDELLQWIYKQALTEGATIEEDAAFALTTSIGQDLKLLGQEIKKMALYVGKDQAIDKQVVQELGVRSLEQNIFSLIENLSSLHFEKAFSIFYDLLKNKEEPVKIVALLARQFRIMLLAKDLFKKGYSHQQIASQLGAHPYAIKVSLQQSTKLDDAQLRSIIRKLAETDNDIKTGKKEKVLALEMFIFYLRGLVSKNA